MMSGSEAKERSRRFVRLTTRNWFVRQQLREIREAAEFAENLIRSERKAIERRWKKAQQEYPADQSEELELYGERLGDEDYRVGEVFAQTFRRSLFLSTYATVEQHLDRLAVESQRLFDLDLKPNQLRDRGITRSATYLSSVAAVDFPYSSAEWRRLKSYNDLRNQLLHVGPWLNLDLEVSRKVQKHFSSSQTVRATERQPLAFEEGFVEEVITTATAFFQTVHDVVRERWESGA